MAKQFVEIGFDISADKNSQNNFRARIKGKFNEAENARQAEKAGEPVLGGGGGKKWGSGRGLGGRGMGDSGGWGVIRKITDLLVVDRRDT